jgi:hypothetical protein
MNEGLSVTNSRDGHMKGKNGSDIEFSYALDCFGSFAQFRVIHAALLLKHFLLDGFQELPC